MQKRNIVFYGDSNTWGYDPADPYERRYPSDRRWTTIVSETLREDFQVFPEGMNGRTLPDLAREQPYLLSLIGKVKDNGILCTMLGTNDIVLTMHSDASAPVRRMEQYLRYLMQHLKPEQILIIAPPLIGREDTADPFLRACFMESRKMNAGFMTLASKCGAVSADASLWEIEPAFDLVHFSEKGHQKFAEKMIQLLRSLQDKL